MYSLLEHSGVEPLISDAWRESFESAPGGPISRLETSMGLLSADDGHARVDPARGKSGKHCLHLSGQGERAIVLQLPSPAEKGSLLSFFAERWTRAAPFQFRIDAKEGGKWREIRKANQEIKVGGFLTEVRQALPEGTREVRFHVIAPEKAGILIDDVRILRPGPARASSVEPLQAVLPAFIRKEFNPVLGFCVSVEVSEGTTPLEAIEIGFGGTTLMDDIASFKIFADSADPSAEPGKLVAEGTKVSEKMQLVLKHDLAAGDHWFWVSPALKDTASIDGRIDASVFRVKVGGKVLEPARP